MKIWESFSDLLKGNFNINAASQNSSVQLTSTSKEDFLAVTRRLLKSNANVSAKDSTTVTTSVTDNQNKGAFLKAVTIGRLGQNDQNNDAFLKAVTIGRLDKNDFEMLVKNINTGQSASATAAPVAISSSADESYGMMEGIDHSIKVKRNPLLLRPRTT